MASTDTSDRRIKMGLGDAVLRLVHVELRHANGLSVVPGALKHEREMIKEALNQYTLDLGVSCDPDQDGSVPDVNNLFQRTAETSCCRIQFGKSSRKSSAPVITNVVEEVVAIPIETPVKETPPVRGSSRRAAK